MGIFDILARRADKDLLLGECRATVGRLSYHPFIIMAVGSGAQRTLTVCETQNEIPAFADRLKVLLLQHPSRFLQAFLTALHHEDYGYEAGFGFYDWIMEDSPGYRVNAIVNPRRAPFRYYAGYPVLEVAPGKAPSPDERAKLLQDMFQAYATMQGNDQYRGILADAMAIALAKFHGSAGRYDTAHEIVRTALRASITPMHLRAADFALSQKRAGARVPERLEKFIGAGTGPLSDRICGEPFRRFDIGPSGEVLVCCGHWLPSPLGNILTDTIDNVLNSSRAQNIRKSVTDGSFRFCNHLDCAAMIQEQLPSQDTVDDPRMRAAIDHQAYTVDRVEQMMFAFDRSCNLSCPSCRMERIIEKPSENTIKEEAIETKLVPLLRMLKQLDINPAGEIFSSKPSRRILELVNRQDCPDLYVDIISNGTLFTETEWNRLPNLRGMINSVRISVDGATKPTFEKLRRLAVFETFVKNMTFLRDLRQRGDIPYLKFSFTYQVENFHEMELFVDFARSFACDCIIFERLQNLGAFSSSEFQAKAIHLNNHPRHSEFLEMIHRPIFSEASVLHDFEWKATESTSPMEARERLRRLEDGRTSVRPDTPSH